MVVKNKGKISCFYYKGFKFINVAMHNMYLLIERFEVPNSDIIVGPGNDNSSKEVLNLKNITIYIVCYIFME